MYRYGFALLTLVVESEWVPLLATNGATSWSGLLSVQPTVALSPMALLPSVGPSTPDRLAVEALVTLSHGEQLVALPLEAGVSMFFGMWPLPFTFLLCFRSRPSR